MVMAVVSTFALVLAFGPQLHITLQAVTEVPATETVSEEAPRAVALPSLPSETPVADQSLETIEETVITPAEIAVPEMEPVQADAVAENLPQNVEPEAAESETASQPEAQTVRANSGEVSESEWPSILSDASAALAAANTARGNFIQTNADGSTMTGTFALNRPGRMRFDYDDPTPVLIVSDGTTVAIEDSELETVDRGPIGATPLGIILSTQLDVEKDVDVLSVLQNDQRIGVRVSDANGELEGTMTMVFDKTSYALLGWLTVDANLQTTVVDLTDVETNVRIDPRLFRLNEDDEEEDER